MNNGQVCDYIENLETLEKKADGTKCICKKRCEKTNDCFGKEKSGNYIWGTPESKEFKAKLRISDVVRIIKTSRNWKDVRKKTAQFENNPCKFSAACGTNAGFPAKPMRG